MKRYNLASVDKFGRFDDGRYQAERVCKHPTRRIKGSLTMARESRGKWITRFFRPGKRRYLDGFIARLEEELHLRAEAEANETAPLPPTAVEISKGTAS